MTREFVAEFPLSARATAFTGYLHRTAQGNYVTQIAHRAGSRTVSWYTEHQDAPGTPFYETYFYSMLESVGSYGSDQRRKAKLTEVGVRGPVTAPVEY